VFDARLIWVIEYTDVLKFGLVIFGVLTGYLFLIQGYAINAYNVFFTEDPKKQTIWIKFVTVAFVGSLVAKMLYDETHEEHYYMLHIMLHVSVFLIGVITFWAVDRFRNWHKMTFKDWANDAIGAVVALSLFGQTFGYYTRDMEGFKHEVIIKGVEMHDVGVIMITSHHTVLSTDKGDIVVVPSADVNQIIKRADAK
jgi:hypothetical protein